MKPSSDSPTTGAGASHGASLDQLLADWDKEVREHGIWTSGHSIAAKMAAELARLQSTLAQQQEQKDDQATNRAAETGRENRRTRERPVQAVAGDSESLAGVGRAEQDGVGHCQTCAAEVENLKSSLSALQEQRNFARTELQRILEKHTALQEQIKGLQATWRKNADTHDRYGDMRDDPYDDKFAACLAALPTQEWQLMNTAPKDETEFLMRYNRHRAVAHEHKLKAKMLRMSADALAALHPKEHT